MRLFISYRKHDIRLILLKFKFYDLLALKRVQNERKKYITKFSHRKALVALLLSSVIWPLVTFR
jgi:hypothetical protein